MELIITWAKDNYNLICLGVGVVGVLISIISVIQASKQVKQARKEKKEDFKQDIKQEIAKKRAELKVLESTHHVVDSKTIDDIILRKSILSREIEELEKQL